MYNSVFLIGRAGKDAELFTFENGTKKASFTLATNESWKDKDGNWQEKTEWHNIVNFGAYADKIAEKVVKGALVLVEGKVSTRSWDDKDGNKKYITEIIANKVRTINKAEPGGEVNQDMPEPQLEIQKANTDEYDDDPPF